MTPKECEKIYNEAYRAVYWTAVALLKNESDAEDVVQDTFVSPFSAKVVSVWTGSFSNRASASLSSLTGVPSSKRTGS